MVLVLLLSLVLLLLFLLLLLLLLLDSLNTTPARTVRQKNSLCFC